MTEPCDILILGTGPFAQRIACDLAATATKPTRVAVAGRNTFRLAWILTAARARAQLFARPVAIEGHEIDLGGSGRVAELLAGLRATVIVQAASLQPASVISGAGNAWTRLVSEGGLSATAVSRPS
jgi:saccharopine dehydrogenase-like NADP-dependent oxidoreductase